MVLSESKSVGGQTSVTFARHQDVAPLFLNRTVKRKVGSKAKVVGAFDTWLCSPRRRQYDKVVFSPGGAPDNHYNLWKGFAVEPVPGDCGLYINHIRSIVCSESAELFEYVFSWMAHAVQKPQELPGTALVMRGKQGVGKSFFVQTFGALFGQHFVEVNQKDHLLGKFNNHLQQALVISAEEAVWAGDRAAEGVLKGLITGPTRLIEGKGRDPISVGNFTHLLVSSNQDWVVPAGLDERRMVMIDVSDARMQDSAYFAAVAEQMDERGLSALLDLLLKRDISTFNPRSFPKTIALLETKLRSAKPLVNFWCERLAQGCNNVRSGMWEREVSYDELHHAYSEYAAQGGERRRAQQSELGKLLRQMVPGIVSVRRRQGASRQVRMWIFPALEECRAGFAAYVGQDIEWPSDDVEEPARKAVPPKKESKF